jgi:long-chain fatty acid transport protein
MEYNAPAAANRSLRALPIAVLALAASGAQPASAGGVLLYEFGTAEVGLAAAGYAARAQDASTAFTNPAGMTRLEGTQALAGGQLMWFSNSFSVGSGTSPGLGSEGGGSALGWGGFVPGAGAFVTRNVAPDLWAGFAVAGNFGSIIDYDDNWVGRYRVQQATLLGLQFVPSIAYRVNDKLSIGAGLNAVYGIFDQKVAINNAVPAAADGRLELDDKSWGFGGNVGMLYEVSPSTRVGLTWTSQVDLDFKAPAQFSGLGPVLSTLLASRGLLDSRVSIGTKIPQQVMASIASRVDDRWSLLGNVGWQQWSKFGQVEVGIDNTSNPVALTTSLPFKDTWHVAVGAQYRLSDPWTLNMGIAYDSGFQEGDTVSPLLPVNAAWRFGVGGEQQVSKTLKWGLAGELIYGGTLDVNLASQLPPALGGRGNLAGSYDGTTALVVSVYGNWSF